MKKSLYYPALFAFLLVSLAPLRVQAFDVPVMITGIGGSFAAGQESITSFVSSVGDGVFDAFDKAAGNAACLLNDCDAHYAIPEVVLNTGPLPATFSAGQIAAAGSVTLGKIRDGIRGVFCSFLSIGCPGDDVAEPESAPEQVVDINEVDIDREYFTDIDQELTITSSGEAPTFISSGVNRDYTFYSTGAAPIARTIVKAGMTAEDEALIRELIKKQAFAVLRAVRGGGDDDSFSVDELDGASLTSVTITDGTFINGDALFDTLEVSGVATSTFASGINITSGCFAVNGSCVGGTGGGGSGTVNSGTQGQVAYFNSNGTVVSGTSSLFISTNGNVGVGTTSPYSKFSVNGQAVATNFVATGTATSTFAGGFTADTNTLVVNAALNTVGIGTDAPLATLHLRDTSDDTALLFETGAGGSFGVIEYDTAQNIFNINSLSNDLGLYAANTIRLYISNAGEIQFIPNGSIPRTYYSPTTGNFGVGTSSPSERLSVGSGNFLVDGFAKASYFIGTSTATSTLGGGLQTAALGVDGTILANGGITTFSGTIINLNGGAYTSQISFDEASYLYNSSIGFNVDGSASFNNGATVFGTQFGSGMITNIAADGSASFATGQLLFDTSGRIQGADGASGAGNLSYSFVNDSDTGFYLSATDEMRFQTGGSDRVTINALGNVGIGSTSPTDMLSVAGTTSITVALKINEYPIKANQNGSLFGGVGSGYNANLKYAVFFGLNAGSGATSAEWSNFFGNNAGLNATNASSSNFFGFNAGSGATNASSSNFFGYGAGQNATFAKRSNFFGLDAGSGATNARDSNFMGLEAGLGATNASFSNFIGQTAGYQAAEANNANFFGLSAGDGATRAEFSNFFGNSAGYLATDAYHSNFLGVSAGQSAASSSNSNFFGNISGYQATNAHDSNFFGLAAGYEADNAYYSNFFGLSAGDSATNAANSNFFGNLAGLNAANASSSNFYGLRAGQDANNATSSNFFGWATGRNATNAYRSNFIGESAGFGATNAANAIFIGYNAGLSDTVNNVSGTKSSILIGNYTSTGGFSNSIAIGQGTANSAADQLNIGRILYATGISSSTTATASALGGAQVGVGTTTPWAKLSVHGTSGANPLFIVASSTAAGAGTSSHFIVLSSGNVGVGTTSPYSRLSVNGQTVATNYIASSTTATSTFGGAIGVGTTTPWRRFSVNGSVSMFGLTTLSGSNGDAVCLTAQREVVANVGAQTCTVSSERFKHDIESLDLNATDMINALRSVSFTYNGNNEERIGFIAEEVAEIDGRLIFTESDGVTPRGVRYEDMVAIAIKGIQELNLKVEPLLLEETLGESLGSRIVAYLKDAIVEVRELTTGTLRINDQVCVDEVCVTKDQFKNMLINAGAAAASNDDEEEEDEEENTEESSEDNNDENATTTSDGTESDTETDTNEEPVVDETPVEETETETTEEIVEEEQTEESTETETESAAEETAEELSEEPENDEDEESEPTDSTETSSSENDGGNTGSGEVL